MDHLDQLRHRLRVTLWGILLIENALVLGSYEALLRLAHFSPMVALGGSALIAIASAAVITLSYNNYVLEPLQALWQAVLHLSPTEQGIAPPTVNDIRLGRELVTSLMAQIYQLATVADQARVEGHEQLRDLHHNFIAQNLPLPLVVLDASETIRFANGLAAEYVGLHQEDMIGKNVYMVLDMSFPTEATFDNWLKTAKINNATAAQTWERVRLNVQEDHPTRLFDLAAYYNRDNADQHETMLVLFDHTKMYSQDDQAISFMALSVHELRTPLTLLRGYIEVFEEELDEQNNPELHGFMLKMHAMAEQLTAYVNNILNVARVDDDQLELKLQSEDWPATLKSSIEMISLRAKVRGITLQCRITKDLPLVALDRLSIREVINNLVDNAIKYSGTSKVIKIETNLNAEGLVETTVQDFGGGIPSSIMPNLFTKFYRDHRNRAQIGGTGLGLYLSKAIVSAHGGNIWVRSREGEGSTFGFTLIPYVQAAQTLKQKGDEEITRGAHGWIKNHSLYRR